MTPVNSISILCYHAIEEGPAPIRISPDRFRRHVEVLTARGAVALTVADVTRHLRAGEPFPDGAVALTFDDALASVFTHAFPVLRSAGLTATVFAVTGRIGGRADWNRREKDRLPVMGPDQLRALHEAGWEIGSHAHTHLPLPKLPSTAIAEELRVSREVLEDLLDAKVGSFAYPYGAHDAVTRRLATAAFEGCATIGARRASLSASSPDCIERVDAWYVRRPRRLCRLHAGRGGAYLAVRRSLRRARASLPGRS